LAQNYYTFKLLHLNSTFPSRVPRFFRAYFGILTPIVFELIMENLKIPYVQLVETFETVLVQKGFDKGRAKLSAELFAKSSLDGVSSHGLNRFPFFVKMIEEGIVDVKAGPTLISSFGLFERWDGNQGSGNLNAYYCMERAITLSKESGIGCVALRNTNHWMRGGNFGWQAVAAGCIGICFTNAIPNMPAWGGSEPVLGNNPLVIAFPRKDGPIVLDMAMSQFSYGKMSAYLKQNKEMPFEAGFDQVGKLTKDPQVILDKELALPIGLWKGAGLALMLDILAAVLSEGDASHQIGQRKYEQNISQVFISLYPAKLGLEEFPEEKINTIIEQFKSSNTFGEAEVRYPGEKTLEVRERNLAEGVPVDREIWEKVLRMKNE
jgi:3-dehydro-L-gulonate 2-dehydrogenase